MKTLGDLTLSPLGFFDELTSLLGIEKFLRPLEILREFPNVMGQWFHS